MLSLDSCPHHVWGIGARDPEIVISLNVIKAEEKTVLTESTTCWFTF